MSPIPDSVPDAEFLHWLCARLEYVYGEKPGTDFVQRLRRIADSQPIPTDFHFMACQVLLERPASPQTACMVESAFRAFIVAHPEVRVLYKIELKPPTK